MIDTPKYQLLEPLTERQYTDLKEDIGERGILQPVVIDEFGDVIDGHHRKRIAEELGTGYPTHQLPSGLSEADKLDASVALNLMGRSQTPEQKRDTIRRYLRRRPLASGRLVARLIGVDNKTVEKVRAELVASEEIPRSEIRETAIGTVTRHGGGRKPKSTPPQPDPEAVAKRQADLDKRRAKEAPKQAAKHAEQAQEIERWREAHEAIGGAVRDVSRPPPRAFATQDQIKAAMNDCILALTRALQNPGLDVDLIRAEQTVAPGYRITDVHKRLKALVKEFGDKLDELKRAEKASRMARESPVREQ